MVERVDAVYEVIERLPVQLLGEEEVLQVVLLGLQVLLCGGLPHILPIGDLLVFVVGEDPWLPICY